MHARSTDQSGPTGAGNSTGHWHDGSWYTNSECPCPLAQAAAGDEDGGQ